MAEAVFASFNLHAGVDGWSRPFGLSQAWRRIDADVVVLEECWAPDGGRSLALDLASEFGYDVIEVPLARAYVLAPTAPPAEVGGPASWGPGRRPGRAGPPRAIRLAGPTGARRRRLRPGERDEALQAGSWGISLLSRLPIRRHEVLELSALRHDPADRVAIVAEIGSGDQTIWVAGTHLGHLRHGSYRQMRALSSALRRFEGPGVVLGDLNCWGLPVLAMMPGWRKAVNGRTWPAWRPHSQLDHVLVRHGTLALGGEVLPGLGSDHRAVRARVAW